MVRSFLKQFGSLPRWMQLVMLIGGQQSISRLYRLVRFIYLELVVYRTCKDIKARYSGYNECWAVITGGSKGVGLGFSRQLAKRGFNIVIVARDVRAMELSCKELKDEYGVKCVYVECDMINVGLEDSSCRKLLEEVDKKTDHGDIAMLVHSAGNSDLARHLTDHPLKRNRDMLLLNTLGTLSMIQTFMPKLVHRSCRSAIITMGAQTAFRGGMAGFATSSANKHYVRALSLIVSKEYEDQVDVMCAHPFAVESNILKAEKGVSVAITADSFAQGVLSRLGRRPQVRETYGNALHEILYWVLGLSSFENRLNSQINRIPQISEVLDRPVNLAPIREKLKLGDL
mmetsp:Transcript_9853/g.16129  ORF Transcript_9853/g.16129 Transcript_9853/m.16129 type:complete len:343 (-) Transcript_9853:39-1067(-)